jgi:peptidoglycan/LPS O-acetylase OafA/YrhL
VRRFLVYIGRLSYGLYIWHFPVAMLLNDTSLRTRTAWVLVFSFAMAALCLHLVDVPIKRWRERKWSQGGVVGPVTQRGI